MVFFSLRKIRSISIVIVQAGLLVLVLRILEHGPNLGIPGQQQIQGDHCQNDTQWVQAVREAAAFQVTAPCQLKV